MDDQKILSVLEKSPLKPEDKQHWVELMDQMTEEQKTRLYHTVIVKTDIKRASGEIETALNIINQALEEEQQATDQTMQSAEPPAQQLPPSVVQQAVQQTNIKDHVSEDKIDDPGAIKQKHEEVQSRLEELRGELASLSKEVSGDVPPSYQNS